MAILDRGGGDASADADGTAGLAEKVRAAVDSVSKPEIKAELSNWADGFALLAETIHDDAQRTSVTTDSPDEYRRMQHAGDLIYRTAEQLRVECPAAFR